MIDIGYTRSEYDSCVYHKSYKVNIKYNSISQN